MNAVVAVRQGLPWESDGRRLCEIALPDTVTADRVALSGYLKDGKISGYFGAETEVADTLRGTIEFDNGFVDYSPASQQKLNAPLEKSVVLILDSPHRDEYALANDGMLRPLFPVPDETPGSSAGAIRKYLGGVVEQMRPKVNGTFPVAVLYAVPYQTSLVHLLGLSQLDKDVRNDVWAALWACPDVQADFVGRLKACSPKLVVNACAKPAYHEVTRTLQEQGLAENACRTDQPAVNWHKAGGRYKVVRL